MIVVDTSAIVALLFDEDGSVDLEHRLSEEQCMMSAATRVELGIVIEAKTGSAGTQLLEELLGRVAIKVLPVDAELLKTRLWHGDASGGGNIGLV